MPRLTPLRLYRAIRWRVRNRWLLWRLKSRCPGLELGTGIRISGKLSVTGHGTVRIGDDCEFAGEAGSTTTLITSSPDAGITIGPRCRFNGTYVFAASSVTIGSDCLLADAHLFDTDHHVADYMLREQGVEPVPRPVSIGDHVWICSRAAVLKGVSVGDGAVVGYRAVVRRDVPVRAIVIGNPAEVVKRLDEIHAPPAAIR